MAGLSGLASSLFVAFAISFPGPAGTKTAHLSVTANIPANCTISTAPVAFGAYDPVVANGSTPLRGTGTITTTCTRGAIPLITFGQGAYAGSGSTDEAPVRRLADGSHALAYGLYQDPGHSTVWGNTAGTAPPPVAATALSQSATVYGQIAAGQDLPTGAYGDIVVVTVTF